MTKIKNYKDEIISIPIRINVFPGFYSGPLADLLDEYLETYEIDTNNPEFNTKKLYQEWGESYISAVLQVAKEKKDETICELFPILNIKFNSIWSPKSYNYTTDQLYCDITFNKYQFLEFFMNYLIEEGQYPNFVYFLKCEFSDKPGFTSFYPPEITDWLFYLIPQTIDKDPNIMAALVQFLIEPFVDEFGDSIMELKHYI